MIRLHCIVEGDTERNFVNKVLAPHLGACEVFADARCVFMSRDRKRGKIYRGGMSTYGRAKGDIERWMKEDSGSDCRYTTMFDFYGLPEDFPGYANASCISDPYKKVESLEGAFDDDIADRRFIPYIQLYEFEALVFADPAKLGLEYLEHADPIGHLADLARSREPELIDNGPVTAPSKRIIAKIPDYDKAGAGVDVVAAIGLDVLRAKCPHFGRWLERLEKLKL